MIGTRSHQGRRFDRSTDLWPLALISFGESWHNGHHAAPTCARHGSRPHQIDLSAGVIRIFERLGWATGVHWPSPQRASGPPLPNPRPRQVMPPVPEQVIPPVPEQVIPPVPEQAVPPVPEPAGMP
jgi:hypothetical protein